MARTVSALEAAEILGISFNAWRCRMYAFHKGTPKKEHGEVVRDFFGKVQRNYGAWMPTPLGPLGYANTQARFRLTDIQYLAQEWYGTPSATEEPEVELPRDTEPEIMEACKFFGVSPPEKWSAPVDLSVAKKAYWREVKIHHPDRHHADPVAHAKAAVMIKTINAHMDNLKRYNEEIESA